MKAFSLYVFGFLALTASAASAGDYDGTYNIRTVWSGNFCGTQDIDVKVSQHRFSFLDGGNYRWSGYVNNAGIMTLTESPTGGEIKRFGQAPQRTGLQNAHWGQMFWSLCGQARIRLYRKSVE